MHRIALLVLLAGCRGGDGGDVATPAADPLDGSWVGTLATAPDAFTQVVDADRDAWIALHSNNLAAAARSHGQAGDRARLALGTLYSDLARLNHRAWADTMEAWQQKGTLPEDSALYWFAAVAALEGGDVPQARAWLEKAEASADPLVAQAAQALSQAEDPAAALPEEGDNLLIARLNAHRSARQSGALGVWADQTAAPLHRERAGDHERAFYDPQLFGTLAVTSAKDVERPGALAGVLFSDCPTPEALAAAAAPTDCAQATLALMGVTLSLGETDDPEAARALVRALDARLDPWVKTRIATASPDGAELLRGLSLGPRLRGELLVSLAREQLAVNDHPHQALALLQLAMDLETPRAVGPVNSPSLFALTAEANLRTGHTREALDALQVLRERHPEVAGVDEIVGDLAILRGLDRRGDSKEN
ncbi:MAG: hypothetical protein H6739_24190 [Alphaproteobacteria bacterium]|nr:hypothetical protein [Alphaproteobacteria bacterium]